MKAHEGSLGKRKWKESISSLEATPNLRIEKTPSFKKKFVPTITNVFAEQRASRRFKDRFVSPTTNKSTPKLPHAKSFKNGLKKEDVLESKVGITFKDLFKSPASNQTPDVKPWKTQISYTKKEKGIHHSATPKKVKFRMTSPVKTQKLNNPSQQASPTSSTKRKIGVLKGLIGFNAFIIMDKVLSYQASALQYTNELRAQLFRDLNKLETKEMISQLYKCDPNLTSSEWKTFVTGLVTSSPFLNIMGSQIQGSFPKDTHSDSLGSTRRTLFSDPDSDLKSRLYEGMLSKYSNYLLVRVIYKHETQLHPCLFKFFHQFPLKKDETTKVLPETSNQFQLLFVCSKTKSGLKYHWLLISQLVYPIDTSVPIPVVSEFFSFSLLVILLKGL